MWRASLKIAACLLLGVVTSVAVAWIVAVRGCRAARWNLPSRVASFDVASQEATVYEFDHVSIGCDRLYTAVSEAMLDGDRIRMGLAYTAGGDVSFPRVPRAPWTCHPPNGKANDRKEYQFGWPARCMWAASDERQYADMIMVLGNRHVWCLWPWEALDPSSRPDQNSDEFDPFHVYAKRQHWYVPTGFLARGVAIDSAAFAVAWWLALLAPGRVGAALRRRRGQCLACGYSLAGNTSGVCPECGGTVKVRAEAGA